MNEILSRESVFKDALNQLSREGINNPFGVHSIHNLDELEEIIHTGPNMHVFFIGEDIILYHFHKEKRYFHISNKNYSSRLERIGDVISGEKNHFALLIFYTIFHVLANISPLKKPFTKNWKTFQNKLVYYLEIPLDPITFSKLGVDPDLTATNFYEVISYGETTS